MAHAPSRARHRQCEPRSWAQSKHRVIISGVLRCPIGSLGAPCAEDRFFHPHHRPRQLPLSIDRSRGDEPTLVGVVKYQLFLVLSVEFRDAFEILLQAQIPFFRFEIDRAQQTAIGLWHSALALP